MNTTVTEFSTLTPSIKLSLTYFADEKFEVFSKFRKSSLTLLAIVDTPELKPI